MAHEAGGERGKYTFTLSGGNPSMPLTLQYRVRNPNPPEPGVANDDDYSLPGSAVAGAGEHAGYTLRSITFNPGVTVATVDLTPAPDSRVEGDETVAAEVVPQAGGLYGAPGVVAGGAAAVITIKDKPVVSLSQPNVGDAEASELDEEPGGFRVSRARPEPESLEVHFRIPGSGLAIAKPEDLRSPGLSLDPSTGDFAEPKGGTEPKGGRTLHFGQPGRDGADR